jgi:hypothetical protein
LQRNHRDGVSLLRRNRLLPEADALIADEECDGIFPAFAIRRSGVRIPSQSDLPQVGLADLNRRLDLAPAPAGAGRAHPLSRSRRHPGSSMPIH